MARAMEKPYDIKLDTKIRNTQVYQGIKQGDDLTVFYINLFQNNVAFNLTGLKVRLNIERYDGAPFFQDETNGVTIKDAPNGRFEVVVNSDALAVRGKATADVTILDANYKKITSASFSFIVEGSVYDPNALLNRPGGDLIQKVIDTEQERINSETHRQVSEVERAEAEELREEIFDEMESKYKAAMEFSVGQATLETIDARDGEAKLGDNIRKVKAQLADIANEFDHAVGAITEDSEVVLARNSGVKAKTYDTLDARFEGLEADTYFPIENIAVNGDFNNGFVGWTQGTVKNNLTVVNGRLKSEATTDGGSKPYVGQWGNWNIPIGDKLYIAFDMLTNKEGVVNLALSANESFGAILNGVNFNIGTIFSRQSTIISSTSIAGGVRFNANSHTVVGDYIELDNIIVIDLTATFGAGNEPTKEQMDSLLANYPNSYFEGTVNLAESPKMLKYLLKQSQKAEDSYFPVKNEIINGDFNYGTDNWVVSGSTIAATGNTVISTALGTLNDPRVEQLTSIPCVEGHKIFISSRIRSLDNPIYRLGVMCYGSPSAGTSFQILVDYPTINSWYKLSGIYTIPANASGFVKVMLRHYYTDAESSLNKRIEFDDVIAINLTTTFGLGNEPSKEEMESLLSTYPNTFFNGTINLSDSKKFLPWLLNQFRSKANITQENWIIPTLLNGWSSTNFIYGIVRYFKDQFGYVFIEGYLFSGTEDTAFILPVGYRPKAPKQYLVVDGFGSTTSPSPKLLTVSSTTGEVKIPIGIRPFLCISFRSDI